jgi:glycine cleavage system aminomethyltransferase T
MISLHIFGLWFVAFLDFSVLSAMHVYERILRAGEGLPLTHAGLKALGSLRMEKAYRDYGTQCVYTPRF